MLTTSINHIIPSHDELSVLTAALISGQRPSKKSRENVGEDVGEKSWEIKRGKNKNVGKKVGKKDRTQAKLQERFKIESVI